MTDMAGRIEIVSAERVRDELVKLVCAPYPRRGLSLLVETGLAAHVLPELPALALERDEHHRHKDVYEHTLTVLEQSIDLEDRLPGGGPDFVARFAALMHDVGKPRTRRFLDDGSVTFHHHDVVGAKITRKRMKALRFSNDEIDAVAKLVELHLRFHGYGSGEWTDSAVRRYVRDAGDQLERLHVLTRADCTTRNRRKAERLRRPTTTSRSASSGSQEQEELDSHPPRPRRQPDHGDPRHPPRPGGRRGVPVPARAAPRPRPALRGRRQGRAAGVVGGTMTGTLTVFAVATPYAWDVVESARRAGLEPVCVDNHGGADQRLPGLTAHAPDGPFVLGLSSAPHRAAAAHLAHAAGLRRPGQPGRPDGGRREHRRPRPRLLRQRRGRGGLAHPDRLPREPQPVGLGRARQRDRVRRVVRSWRGDRRWRRGRSGGVRRRRCHDPAGGPDRATCDGRRRARSSPGTSPTSRWWSATRPVPSARRPASRARRGGPLPALLKALDQPRSRSSSPRPGWSRRAR